MGDYAGFVARVKKNEKASELKRQLEEEGGSRLFADDDLGLVIGIMKAYAPGDCKLKLITKDSIEQFASLSEKANSDSGNDDYSSILENE